VKIESININSNVVVVLNVMFEMLASKTTLWIGSRINTMKPAAAAVVVSVNADTAGTTLASCRTKFCVPAAAGNYKGT